MLAISGLVIVAVNWVLLLNVVVRGRPFQFTVEDEIKFDPLTVSVKVPPPAEVLVGEIVVMLGTGLFAGGGGGELPPPPPQAINTPVSSRQPASAKSGDL